MFELKGKYNSCIIFTDDCEDACVEQLRAFLDQRSAEGCKIRIMPDCHAGAGCVIGTTMTLHGQVIPNLVGVDVGCGVLVVKLREQDIELPLLDAVIHRYIPAGFNVHDTQAEYPEIANLKCAKSVNMDRALKSLGTLGGGNHFIEVDRSESGELYLIIHTGSRHLGNEVCTFYQDAAYERLFKGQVGDLRTMTKELIEKLKAEGRHREIADAIKAMKADYARKVPDVPHDLAYVEGDLYEDYIHDMRLTQKYAAANRAKIAETILYHMDLHEVSRFETIHNYVDTECMILRKGAVSAQEGERLIVPINMRDGSLICVGKGNPDWNCSAPHGAGRLMSRRQARKNISMDDYQKSMEGIYTSCVEPGTLDESPMAYKPIDEIMENVKDTVRIEQIIHSIYNFKAGDE